MSVIADCGLLSGPVQIQSCLLLFYMMRHNIYLHIFSLTLEPVLILEFHNCWRIQNLMLPAASTAFLTVYKMHYISIQNPMEPVHWWIHEHTLFIVTRNYINIIHREAEKNLTVIPKMRLSHSLSFFLFVSVHLCRTVCILKQKRIYTKALLP